MPLTYPTSLTQGTTANATDVQGMFDAITTLLNTTKLDNSYIVAGTLTTTQLSSSAGILSTQLASTTAGNVLIGLTSTGVPTWTALTGDIGVTGGGVTSISSGVIVNADVNASAAIAYSKLNLAGAILNADLAGSIAVTKLVAGTDKQVLLNNGTTPTWTTLSGDVTVGSTGTTAIGSLKVLTAMINTNAVTSSKLSVTTGDVRATNANQGLTQSGVDLAGLDTTAITVPTGATTIDVEASVQFGGFTQAATAYMKVLESVNAAAYTDLSSSTFGATDPSAYTPGASNQPVVACAFSRSVTPGDTVRYKVQVSGNIANGNATKAIATFIRYRFLK